MSLEYSSARQDQPDTLDLLVGAKRIAAFMGVRERQIYYWHEKKRFRFFNIGEQIAARKSTLCEDLKKLEAGEAA
jgi:hypothetical protein